MIAIHLWLVNCKFTDYQTTDCDSNTFAQLVNFKFSDYRTTDHGSNTLSNTVNFTFINYETTDHDSKTFTHSVSQFQLDQLQYYGPQYQYINTVNFRFTDYGTKDHGSNTFTHQFPYHWLRTVVHDSNTLNKKICDQVFWSCSHELKVYKAVGQDYPWTITIWWIICDEHQSLLLPWSHHSYHH